MKKLTATSTALLIAGLSIFQTATVAALGPNITRWAASADVLGSPGESITITDSTYAGCVNQFNNAMASHGPASSHGYVFTNIRNCSQVSSGHLGGQRFRYERKLEEK